MNFILKNNGKIPPRSCDTFAVLPPNTENGCVVFGKNSDRPSDEVQEVVYVPAEDHPVHSKVKCTYIEIEQVPHTHAVVLSKPSWMWGAEMGSNEHNVCIGNEAVWTVLNNEEDSIEKLLGMDLLRLALERAETALEALQVIVALVDQYGMGGNCSNTLHDFTYHNSFLIADPAEVWILEVAGTIWAAERVVSGVRNISNELSIGTKIDLKSKDAEDFAKKNGYWKPEKEAFNFKKAYEPDYSCEESGRYRSGKRLLGSFPNFSAKDMFFVLRDKRSGICMSPPDSFVTTGSQVSVLQKPGSGKPSCHWFTATPDPSRSVFKPFFFADDLKYPDAVRALKSGDETHQLYRVHEKVLLNSRKAKFPESLSKDLENKYLEIVLKIVENGDEEKLACKLFYEAVIEELSLYEANK